MKDYVLDIPSDNPFKNDCFGREIIARNFMKIFDNDEEGIILSIDSGWGTGKTTFIKMWESLINNDKDYKDKYETLYFNAWDSDYMQDPLLAILTEVEINRTSGVKKCINTFAESAKNLVSVTNNVATKIATAGVLELKDFDLSRDDLEKEYPKLVKSIGLDRLELAMESKKIRTIFKGDIEKKIRKSDKKIIFFIDELDRCRPKFAIELLESIKHLFSMNGIIFVISLDKEQLGYSIANVYGENMDTTGYLRRFFDLDFKLPLPDKKKYFDTKCEKIFSNYSNIGYFKQFLMSFIKEQNFSFRDMDKMFYYLKFILPLINEFKGNNYSSYYKSIVSYLYAYLISLKVKNHNLYKKIIELDYSYDESNVISTFKLDDIENIYFRNEYDEAEQDEDMLNVLKSDVIKKFLMLLNLKNNFNMDLSIYDDSYFKIIVRDKIIFDMERLFIKDRCQIIENLEFMNDIKIN